MKFKKGEVIVLLTTALILVAGSAWACDAGPLTKNQVVRWMHGRVDLKLLKNHFIKNASDTDKMNRSPAELFGEKSPAVVPRYGWSSVAEFKKVGPAFALSKNSRTFPKTSNKRGK